MCLWCGGVGRCRVFGWVYVDMYNGARSEIGMLWICDVPVSYAKVIDDRYGFASSCTQMCGTGFWVSKESKPLVIDELNWFKVSTGRVLLWYVVSGGWLRVWIPPGDSFDVSR